MRKLKVGLTTAFMLLVLSIFSITAIAAEATAPKIKSWDSTANSVTFTWEYTGVPAADSYKVEKITATGTTDVYTGTDTTYTGTGLTVDDEVIWEVIAVVGTEEHATEFIMTAGGPAFNTDKLKAKFADDDTDYDNGIVNANESGVGVGGQTADFNKVIKSDNQVVVDKDGKQTTQTTHRTHGEYQNNTNSCASCHQTHTAASKNLLFKNGVYTTCTACHDGTLGFYNVFETGANASKSAGTFGGTHDGNMSIHLANGAVSVKAAPGGNRNGEDGWAAEFTCASCHAPHGSYSDRLLHFNPNHMGTVLMEEGGKKLVNVPIVTDKSSLVVAGNVIDSKDATKNLGNFILYKSTLAADPAAGSDYGLKGLKSGDTVIQLMKWNGTTYADEKDPWIHGYDWDASHTNKIYWSRLLDGSNVTKIHTDDAKDFDVIFGNGFVAVKSGDTNGYLTKLNAATKADLARAYVVKLDMVADTAKTTTYGVPIFTTNVKALWKGTNWGTTGATKSGYGVKMSNYCSSCHTDYLASSGTATGTWNKAYRHSTTSDSYTCVRCHYAHGTDVTVMMDAEGNTVDQIVADTTNYFSDVTDPTARTAKATEYMMDKAPSSALKRFTNMAVCWGCHTSSHSEGFRNGDSFEQNSGKGGSHDYIGLPNGN